MNDNKNSQDEFRSFQLMNEIESGESVSQRELAKRLGVAVGLVNSYLKNFVAKGYVRVKNYPRNRYAYLLTPKGFAEKSRLALQHMSYFSGLYTTTRRQYLELFHKLKAEGVCSVVFCGVDEVAEIAYLSLMDVGGHLEHVCDDQRVGDFFFGHEIAPIESISPENSSIVIASLKRKSELYELLKSSGLTEERIYFPES